LSKYVKLNHYDSDLKDEEWQTIEPLLLPDKPVDKNREENLRDVVNAIFYQAITASNGVPY